jgi:outer membrane protein TolC
MGQAGKYTGILLSGLLAVTGCSVTAPLGGQEVSTLPIVHAPLAPPATSTSVVTPELPAVPASQPDDRPLPINLPTAMQLAHLRNVDIAAAAERVQVAAAILEQARAQWLPSITLGADFSAHAGPIQDVSNAVFNDSHNSVMVGGGTGIGPAAVLSVNDAIFAPLVARQHVRAGEADSQATANDTLVAVTDAYFTVQQSRGELAGAVETTRRMEELVRRTTRLAPALVPDLETDRAETELGRRQQAELLARERWKTASASLARVLRLDPDAQIEPAEPPQLRVELIDLKKPVNDLIAIALTSRPELASQQSQVQATLALLKRERWRPLIPSIVLRGASTPGGTLAGGGFFPSPSGSGAGMRGDVDLQVLWQLNNLGLGNIALVHQREAENRAASLDLLRIEDRVAEEVVQTHAQAQLAARRVDVAEKAARSALKSADKNLVALGQTKAAGNQVVLLVRPQEAVAAVQALAQAYVDYYGAVADANRAQFRLYRALGQSAQCLVQDQHAPTLSPAVTLSPTVSTSIPSQPAPDPSTPSTDSGNESDSAPTQWKASHPNRTP